MEKINKIVNKSVTLVVDKGIFSFIHTKRKLGFYKISFQTEYDDKKVILDKEFSKYNVNYKTRNISDSIGKGKEVVITLSNRSGYTDEILKFWLYNGKSFLIFQHNIKNSLNKQIFIKGLVDGYITTDGSIVVGESLSDTVFCHTQNVKIDYFDIGSTETGNYIRSIEGVHTILGDGQDQPFPAVFFSSRNKQQGIVDAVLTQKIRYREIEIDCTSLSKADGITKYIPRMTTRGIDKLKLAPGEIYEGEKIYLEIAEHNDPQKAYNQYLEVLNKLYKFRGKDSCLRNEVIWGSWNYGVFTDVTSKIVLKNAKFIKSNPQIFFDKVKWIELDDGYQLSRKNSYITFAYPDVKNPEVDKTKFPRGMKYVVNKLKSMGFKTAIWLGLMVNKESRLAKEHPDWLLQWTNGERVICGNIYVLDISVPEVREFIVRVLKIIFKEWGFEGIKLDFWSYCFECKGISYKFKDKSSLEWREWLLKTIRSFLPSYGFIMTGCCCAMGNPFLGIYVDVYRFGLDIHDGTWQHIVSIPKWGVPLFPIGGENTWLMDIDSVGINESIPENENRLWFTFGLVTRSLIEVGGDLTKLSNKSLEDLKKVFNTEINNGIPVFFGDFSIKEFNFPPRIWWSCDAKKRYIALFNFGEVQQEIVLKPNSVGLKSNKKYKLKEFWTKEIMRINNLPIRFLIPPRTAKLYVVTVTMTSRSSS